MFREAMSGSAGETRRVVGRGEGVAVLFNGRAKQVTPDVVAAMQAALPEARVLVSRDLPEAERHVDTIVAARPQVVFSGGGDGAALRLLNLLAKKLPATEALPAL